MAPKVLLSTLLRVPDESLMFFLFIYKLGTLYVFTHMSKCEIVGIKHILRLQT